MKRWLLLIAAACAWRPETFVGQRIKRRELRTQRQGTTNKSPYSADEYWTRKAREEGVPARAYYKLEELDRRLSLFEPGLAFKRKENDGKRWKTVENG